MRWVAFGLLTVMLAACGSPERKLCRKSSDCTDGYEMEDCMDEAEDLADAADDLDCPDAYRDHVKCAAKEGECTDNGLEAEACDEEAVEFFSCFFGATSE